MKNYVFIVFVSVLFISISSNACSQDFSHNLAELQSLLDIGRTEQTIKQVQGKIAMLEQSKSYPLLLSRHYNFLAEIYHSLQDIQIANTYWKKSYKLIKSTFGEHTVFLAESYSCLAKNYSFLMKFDSAYYFAQVAVEICRGKKDSLRYIPVDEIYREYAYDTKAKLEQKEYNQSRRQARIYFDSAMYFNSKYFPEKAIYQAQLLHDIGNTYTDVVGHSACLGEPKNIILENVTKANEYYGRELKILNQKFGNKHERIAISYFAKELCYQGAFENDSSLQCIKLLHNALVALVPDFNNTDHLSVPTNLLSIPNKALAGILIGYDCSNLSVQFDKTKEIKYIQQCYKNLLLLEALWIYDVKNFSTFEIHKSVGAYGGSFRNNEIESAVKYYNLTKNDSVKNNIFRWINFSKYVSLLKQASEHNLSNTLTSWSISDIQHKINPNECLINQFWDDNNYFVTYITKEKSGIIQAKFSNSFVFLTDSLSKFLKKYEEKKYCRTAKSLYDSIVYPITKELPENITHLIFIPHRDLSSIPYEALVTNQSSTYQNADFLINHYSISYGLSSNLLFDSDCIEHISNSISFLAPDFKKHTQLPFSGKLRSDLQKDYHITNVNSITDSTDNILHVASHAYCNFQESRNSYILLSDKDSILLSELYRTKYKYKLAILSACETAKGKQEREEGAINFTRSLFLAGIKNTITSLWKIDDKSSAEILKLFYANLTNGETTSEALCDAKRQYLKNATSVDERNPILWAGLIYSGNDLVLEKQSNGQIRWLLVGIALVAGIVLLRKLRF